jgi:uncharacterized peroxidase-related enzyme
LINAVLTDWRTAAIGEKMRAMLEFLETITLTPSAVGPETIAPLRRAGVSDQAIEDALVVCALFNIIDRLADAFEVTVPSTEEFAYTGQWLIANGYI